MISLRHLAAVPVLALCLSACGSGSDDSTGPTSTPPASAPTASATPASTTSVPTSPTATATAPPAGGGAMTTVNIRTFQFSPDPLTVAAGTTITFVNEDKIDHTATAGTREAPTPDVFDGLMPEQGATFEVTLSEPGVYDYYCQIHNGPGMTGQIIVE